LTKSTKPTNNELCPHFREYNSVYRYDAMQCIGIEVRTLDFTSIQLQGWNSIRLLVKKN